LYNETQRLKSKKAFKELTEILTEEDLKSMADSSKEFREKFAFKSNKKPKLQRKP
jgi:hypothetical protein